MRTLKAVLLAAAVTAGLPAIATAQRQDDQQQGERHRPVDNGDRAQRPSEAPHGDPGNAQRAQVDQQRAQADQGRAQADRARQQPAPQAQPPVQSHRGDFRPGRAAPQDDRRFNGAPNPGGNPNANPGDRRPDFRGDQGRPDQGRPDFRPDDRRQGQGNPNVRPDDRRPDFNRGPDGNRGQDFRGGPQGRPDVRQDYRGDNRFDRGWRQDRRYDWRGYRDQNRQIFRLPRYIPPRNWGWGYRRFSVGVNIPYFLFDQQYWIAEPEYYRLPPAYGPYRWVRYYNDALLIDLRSGVVVDEIPDFFW